MPKTVMDYSKCCIYKIEHINDESLVYVGHTTNFMKRKTAHKSNSKNKNEKSFNNKLYQMIRENGGWETFKMIEVEKYPCKDRREASRRENEVMKELKASMNKIGSYISTDEYQEYHKEKNKEYYQRNKETIIYKKKKYREEHKEYYKNYREANKERIKEKVYCECGCEVLKRILKTHKQTNKHSKLMNNL